MKTTIAIIITLVTLVSCGTNNQPRWEGFEKIQKGEIVERYYQWSTDHSKLRMVIEKNGVTIQDTQYTVK